MPLRLFEKTGLQVFLVRLRLVWTLSLPFLVRGALPSIESGRLSPALLAAWLLFGLSLHILPAPARRPQHEVMRLVDEFAPIISKTAAAGILFVLIGSLVFDDEKLVQLLPAITHLAFAFIFGSSLFTARPLIQKFAEAFHQDLNQAEKQHCRRFTLIWTLFFLLNAGVVVFLTEAGNLNWWTFYTGVGGYLAAGALGLFEYILRKYRFGRLTERPYDQLLRWLFESRDS
ncbi:MAG: hypothetical protein MK135_10635 [Polyangiaceae bacterium]|nr:hypothetical protein [Polyangiaceae bacterium]